MYNNVLVNLSVRGLFVSVAGYRTIEIVREGLWTGMQACGFVAGVELGEMDPTELPEARGFHESSPYF